MTSEIELQRHMMVVQDQRNSLSTKGLHTVKSFHAIFVKRSPSKKENGQFTKTINMMTVYMLVMFVITRPKLSGA